VIKITTSQSAAVATNAIGTSLVNRSDLFWVMLFPASYADAGYPSCLPDCPLCSIEAAENQLEDERWTAIAPVEDFAGQEAMVSAHGTPTPGS
jgi:hypothetical protein